MEYTINVDNEKLIKELLSKEIQNIKEQDLDKNKNVTKSNQKKEKNKDKENLKDKENNTPIDGYAVPKEILEKSGIDYATLEKHLMETYDKTDKLLTEKLTKSFEILEEREKLKQKMKYEFFHKIMAMLVVLVCSPLVITFINLNNPNGVTFAISVVSSIVELTTGIIVLPKIIAQYLFNREEDKLYFELIKDLKNYHDSKKNNFH